MQIETIKAKYSGIEANIPSVWSDYEQAGIELARDVVDLWDIKDPEMIRVLCLVDLRVAGMGKPSLGLSKHVYAPFSFAGLYPEMQKSHNHYPTDSHNLTSAASARLSES
jgi:hypothetical protein